MERTVLRNKRNLLLFSYIRFLCSLVVIKPRVVVIIIYLLCSCKSIHIILLRLVVRLNKDRCSVFVALAFDFLVECLELFLVSSTSTKGVVILCSFVVAGLVVIILLPVWHLRVVMAERLVGHVAHEVIQIVLFIIDFALFFVIDPLDRRNTFLLAFSRHLLYLWFDYFFCLFWFNYLHLLTAHFYLLVLRLIVTRCLLGYRIQRQAYGSFGYSVVCAKSE